MARVFLNTHHVFSVSKALIHFTPSFMCLKNERQVIALLVQEQGDVHLMLQDIAKDIDVQMTADGEHVLVHVTHPQPDSLMVHWHSRGGTRNYFYVEMSGTTCRIEEIVVVGGRCVFCVFCAK
jgi:hypothetical protein